MATPVRLFFREALITFIGTPEHIRAHRYDLSSFGPIKGGEGEGWKCVAAGFLATSAKPTKPTKDDKDG